MTVIFQPMIVGNMMGVLGLVVLTGCRDYEMSDQGRSKSKESMRSVEQAKWFEDTIHRYHLYKTGACLLYKKARPIVDHTITANRSFHIYTASLELEMECIGTKRRRSSSVPPK